jgi:endonuclease YncB( thermonuclease family)
MPINHLMRTARREYLFLLLVLLPAAATTASGQQSSLTGRVVGVSDGDTITVLDRQYRQYKVRLAGIDAPESGQDFGNTAKSSLARLVFGREVTIQWQKTDRYDRILGTVFVDRTNVNLEQVRTGLAWFYRHYESDLSSSERSRFNDAEREARAARRGLWQSTSPTPPWDFRHAQRAGSSASLPPSSPVSGRIIGNRNSGIYHLAECPDYARISERNRVYFGSENEARRSGFRKARNCP